MSPPAVRPVNLKNFTPQACPRRSRHLPFELPEPGPQSGPISYCFFFPAMLELAGTKSAENAIGNFYARKFL